ncbi:spermidine/spermine N(1)-acetyltransferase [Polaribacter pacificus]|uniref:Spermidine/spermine N(1)-acetyltransferase n=1 Tax=Polaribacter pacificus TaxID=1775173 RepID=A0A917MCY1_9FLAO|nr:GNAT family N-acetyltransferase [Polaribacter pacificus]GGG93283.1 spermidine/spermine N(1)-acetyltransferase [Polaribacter pacificus]
MIQITPKLSLQTINDTDCDLLFSLMKEVYPKAYAHFWKDDGSWYLSSQYSKTNILKELSQEKSDYYFVLFNNEIIGNFRVVWDEKLAGIPTEKQLKLHRIYLDSKVQGEGIGKTLLSWLESNAKEKNYQTIWLDAMNEQAQAFEFYKKLGYQYHSHCFLDFTLLKDEVRKMSQIYKNM